MWPTLHPDLQNTLDFVGIEPTDEQRRQFEAFRHWLVTEAVEAGGIGPNEAPIVENRHIADSLLYMPPGVVGSSLLDIGSGAGLPGLVLAIAHPEIAVTTVDRSGRRVDLMKRATRVLSLDNVTVRHGDVHSIDEHFDIVTVRAVFPPAGAVEAIARLGPAYGVIGLSRTAEISIEYPAPAGFSLVQRKFEVLEPPSWMLIMARI